MIMAADLSMRAKQANRRAGRKAKDIAFGAAGVRHKDDFVDGGLCGQIAVYAEIHKPTLSRAKTLMPFECGR